MNSNSLNSPSTARLAAPNKKLQHPPPTTKHLNHEIVPFFSHSFVTWPLPLLYSEVIHNQAKDGVTMATKLERTE